VDHLRTIRYSPGMRPAADVRLFLFDIDGTLLTAHGAGRRALESAMLATYGTAGDVNRYDFRGKTDPLIVSELVTGAGIPRRTVEDRLAACFDAYVVFLGALLADGHPVDLIPGVAGVVEALRQRPDALVGLLTGNIQRGAELKLAPTGLLPVFRLGAYGSDDRDRRRLPAVARARAEALLGAEIPFDRVTVIGDTPLDVDCAAACGARAVAVATGQHSLEELACCSPHLLLPGFQDVQAVVAALTN
jgi:phosphoglycolate phosphatase